MERVRIYTVGDTHINR